MHRRTFLHLAAGIAAVTAVRGGEQVPVIQTVRGPVPASTLGRTLPHEHVLVDFIGADAITPGRYDAEKVFAAAVPHVRRIQQLGAQALFEATPAYMGRDPRLLARLSSETGLHVITNTGLYGARQNKFVPAYAHQESAAQLADRWITESRDGIDGTGIRPGFIKSGVDADPKLSSLHRKLIAAAALTHAATGLTIAVHTGRGPGLEALDVLSEHGVGPAAFVWVHAQGARDDDLFAAADRGAWLSCDGLNRPTLTRHLTLCQEMKRRGHLGRVLLSHDAGWYDPAKPDGGTFRPFDLLFTTFLPLLRENGFSDTEINRLTIRNPAAAYGVRVR